MVTGHDLTPPQLDSAYQSGPYRVFQHILLRVMPAQGAKATDGNALIRIDAQKHSQADQLLPQARTAGARFAQLAARYSEDPGRRSQADRSVSPHEVSSWGNSMTRPGSSRLARSAGREKPVWVSHHSPSAACRGPRFVPPRSTGADVAARRLGVCRQPRHQAEDRGGEPGARLRESRGAGYGRRASSNRVLVKYRGGSLRSGISRAG